jgi:hypothetical protein
MEFSFPRSHYVYVAAVMFVVAALFPCLAFRFGASLGRGSNFHGGHPRRQGDYVRVERCRCSLTVTL